MTICTLIITGLAFGSFVNALTWRIQQQEKTKKTKKKIKNNSVDLSITRGRSVCIHCGHELSAWDLIPVLSWVALRGKCRYCHKKIEDSPLVELAMAAVFVTSYVWWPYEFVDGASWAAFIVWLMISIGLMALFVYDLRHFLLPNRIVFPLLGLAAAFRLFLLIAEQEGVGETIVDAGLGVLVGGGFFYLLFQVSQGRWIGGGDVKLGFVIGLTLGPINALVALLAAFYIAAAFILPLMIVKKVSRKSKIPFGPFLIMGFIAAMLWGESVREAYNSLFGI